MRNPMSFLIVIACVQPTWAQGEKTLVNSIDMKLVRVEPGTFTMGTGGAAPVSRAEWLERDYDEGPAHNVKIASAFYLGAFEVTNAQYEVFDPKHKGQRGQKNDSSDAEHP